MVGNGVEAEMAASGSWAESICGGDRGKRLLHGEGGPETWAPLIRGADKWAKGRTRRGDEVRN
jgi:hypothetical protein